MIVDRDGILEALKTRNRGSISRMVRNLEVYPRQKFGAGAIMSCAGQWFRVQISPPKPTETSVEAQAQAQAQALTAKPDIDPSALTRRQATATENDVSQEQPRRCLSLPAGG